MYLHASKDLDEPAHAFSLINASDLLSRLFFTLYVVLVRVCFTVPVFFLGNMREIKEEKKNMS